MKRTDTPHIFHFKYFLYNMNIKFFSRNLGTTFLEKFNKPRDLKYSVEIYFYLKHNEILSAIFKKEKTDNLDF